MRPGRPGPVHAARRACERGDGESRMTRRRGYSAPRQKRGKGSGGSFASRMEDRFRRRFDE